MEKLKWFLSDIYKFSGYGDGSGDGSGDGYGDGSGDGSGDGYGDGSGDGSGSGDGYGDGNGYGYGNGYGSGNGFKINIISGKFVYYIDKIPTVIYSLCRNVAKCATVGDDMQLTPCYVVKVGDCYAHGKTAAESADDARNKWFTNLDPAEKKAEFKSKFKPGAVYKARDFYNWHGVLTGSCRFGRDEFVHQKGIDLEGDMTAGEFLNYARNQFGWENIAEIEEFYVDN